MLSLILFLLQITIQVVFGLASLFCKLLYTLLVLLINAYRDRQSHSDKQVWIPGDRTPRLPPTGDVHDYRGLAAPRELPRLQQSGISMGHYVNPKGFTYGPLFLPPKLLHQHAAVVGPAGSGKTTGIMEPWALELLQSGHSVVMVDVKGDLMNGLGRQALQQGYKVLYWDIAHPNHSLAWNWLDGIQDYRDVEAAVASILGRENNNDPHLFFTKRDRRWLRALIQLVKAVYADQAKPCDLYRLVTNPSKLRDLFSRYPDLSHHQDNLRDLLDFSADEQSRAVSGLLNELHLFTVPPIEQVTSHSDFQLSDIDAQPALLLIGASLADAKAAETFSGLMLSQLFNQVYRRFINRDVGNPRSIYFLIDEAARLKDRIDYEQVLSVCRSAEVGVCLALQDVAQLGDERTASTILTNCHTLITLRGVSAATARYTASRLGERVVQTVEVSRHRGPTEVIGGRGTSIGTKVVPVLEEREIMHPPIQDYCALVHIPSASAKPFFIDLTR